MTKLIFTVLIIFISSSTHTPAYANNNQKGYVVLLHGMKRSAASMGSIEKKIRDQGYMTINIDYPTSKKTIEILSKYIHNEITKYYTDTSLPINFVTHSMGGIVTRFYLNKHRPRNLGRVVMLAPPNKGTEMSDFLQGSGVFEALFGPSGTQLGTNNKSIIPSLGAVDYEVGIVTGDMSLNPLGSAVIPGKDDGTVSVEHSKVEGMTDHIVISASHSFIMYNDDAVAQVLHFLENGAFNHPQ